MSSSDSSELASLKRQREELDRKVIKFRSTLGQAYAELDSALAEAVNLSKKVSEAKAALGKEKTGLREIEDLARTARQIERDLSPTSGSTYTTLFLGEVNIKEYRDAERLKLKRGYENFKTKTNMIFLLFALVQLFYRNDLTLFIWQLWLCYYYMTLALRENILKGNGSNIKAWWTVHHYISICMAVLMLAWRGPVWEKFLDQFLFFTVAQGVVQVMINRYQLSRMYRLVALGKAGSLDVTGEHIHGDASCAPSAVVLLPFLLFVQTFQVLNSAILLYEAWTQPLAAETLPVVVAGLGFGVLGVCNLATTFETYRTKWLEFNARKRV